MDYFNNINGCKKDMLLSEKLVSQGNFLFKYRGILPIIILIPALWLTYVHRTNASSESAIFWTQLFYAISLFGLLIRIYTVGHSAPNTSGRNTNEGQVADSVNSTGIYSLCRHPLYIGNFFMWLGIAALTFHVWFILFFMITYCFYYERIMIAEENFLNHKFKDTYQNMAANVPAIIPNFKNWRKNKNPFSFKKVIIQEKTGILLLNGCFWLFNSIDMISASKAWSFQNCWFVLFMVAIIYYVVIKLLQKTTKVF